MTSKAERIRRRLPNADDGLVGELAAMTEAELRPVLRALGQARADGRAAEVERRRQRRADNRNHPWRDEHEITAGGLRFIDGTGKRAKASLDALRGLVAYRTAVDAWVTMAVGGLRSQGLSDADIAAALGVTRQAVWKRYGRQPELTAGETAAE
jgi:AcrR family transcriptional regulator